MRNVIVLGSDIKLSLSSNAYTNKTVNINVEVVDNYFDYLLLPNGEKINQVSYSYPVNSNGTYQFIIFNKNNQSKGASITVTNIDKEAPNGSCVLTITNSKSYINITASDNIGIQKYVYNNKDYTSSTIDNLSTGKREVVPEGCIFIEGNDFDEAVIKLLDADKIIDINISSVPLEEIITSIYTNANSNEVKKV